MPMRIRRASTLALVTLAMMGGVAFGATKITPALSKNSTDSFSCRVVNANTAPLTGVTVSIISSTGAELDSDVLTNTPAGWTASLVYTGTAPIGYCKVEGSFSKSKLHVTFCIHLSGSQRCEVAVGDPGLK